MRFGLRRTAAALTKVGLLGLVMSGCGGFSYTGQDLRVQTTSDTLYLLARSTGVSRNLCAGLGGDVARATAQAASVDTKAMELAQVEGCYTVRHVIVCSDGDGTCLGQGQRRRAEGATRP